MAHDTPLITTIVVGLCLAFFFGIIANRLRISPLVGYLLAGVLVGPHTAGFKVDIELTNQLAEIGVILLMFGVGLHFSLKDLLSVKAIALPGAIAQMAFATLLGIGLGYIMGWGLSGGIVFGLALSTASTVVLLRAMQERLLLETERGKIAIGWLIVEDLAMVLALVLVPAMAGAFGGHSDAPVDPLISYFHLGIWGILGLTIAKVVVFVALMLIVGRRVIPWVLKITAQSGSRELFRLSVLAIALGVAFGAANLFGVSLALGAFFAGMIMSESDLSHQAAEESLPLRDAFAVLFFVSVGMLFNPFKVLTDFLPLLATLFIIIIGKSFAAFLIVRAFKHANGTALTISASLAQIGEFSFILASLGTSLGLLNDNARDLILAGAILSILLNPLVFLAADKIKQRLDRKASNNEQEHIIEITENIEEDAHVMSTKTDHTIIVGYGQIGKKVAQSLLLKDGNLLVVEDSSRIAENARQDGMEAICGNAINQQILDAANILAAKQIVIAVSSTIEAGQVVAKARLAKNEIKIIAHGLSTSETSYLSDLGADIVVTDMEEIANGILRHLSDNKPKDTIDPIVFDGNVENIDAEIEKTRNSA